MTEHPSIPDWARPLRSEQGPDELFIWFVVFGHLDGELPPADPATYRSLGPNERFDLKLFRRDAHRDWMDTWTADSFPPARRLRSENPALATDLAAAPHCIDIRVRGRDPADLADLRDAVGMVSFLLDHGGAGVLDAQTMSFFTPESWTRQMRIEDEPDPGRHTVILVNDEQGEGPKKWLHSRGMRKFARPDISIRMVPSDHSETAVELCNRLIVHQALGAIVPDGQPVRMDGAPDGMTIRTCGSYNDPDFNNRHLEIVWPDRVPDEPRSTD